MGVGHVMRCLALAQAWQDAGGAAEFVLDAPEAVRRRLAGEGLATAAPEGEPGSATDGAALAARATAAGAAWVVVDGYHFSPFYQEQLRSAGLRVLCIDDHAAAARYVADLVLDQNVGAAEEDYRRRAPHTRLLLGLRYALLRRSYLPWRAHRREFPPVARRLLVTLGGADPHQTTRIILEAVALLAAPAGGAGGGVEVRVVVGGANPHREAVRRQAVALRPPAEVLFSPPELAPHMAWAEAVVVPASVTCWEALFMGVPALVPTTAENQGRSAERLAALGAAVPLGRHTELQPPQVARAIAALLGDPGRRAALSAAGRALVDGQGAARVVTHMLAATAGAPAGAPRRDPRG